MGIKAVIMDGDGSTITSDNIVPENLKVFILNNPHIKWIMATGRSLELLKRTPIFEFLSPEVPHILDGGGCLMYKNGEHLIKYAMSPDYLEIFFENIVLDDVNFLYFSPDGKAAYAYSAEANFASKFKFHDQYVSYSNNINEFKLWAKNLLPCKMLVNTKTSNHKIYNVYAHQNENNFDVTNHDVNKGSACFNLLRHLGLAPNEAAFVFNDLNDLPIVEHVSLQEITTIKVGNMLPEVDSKYHVQTPYQVAGILEALIFC